VERIRQLAEATHPGLAPDQTLVFDCPYEVSRSRLSNAGRDLDRFESEERAFFERVRAGYQALARAEPGRVYLIDGSKASDKVKVDIQNILYHIELMISIPSFSDLGSIGSLRERCRTRCCSMGFPGSESWR
jgi:thymidylate kinase